MSGSGFSEEAMRQKLNKLSCQAESIETLSLWLIHHQRQHADIIVNVWLKEMRRESTSARLVNLVYLANDVIQNSRKKAPTFPNKFFAVLEPAFRHCSKLPAPDLDRAINKVLKVFKDRQIYTEEQVERLLSASQGRKYSGAAAHAVPAEIYGANKSSSKEVQYDPEAVSQTSNDVLVALRKLDVPPSADAVTRHKLAAYPEVVGNPHMLESIRNAAEVSSLLEKTSEAEPLAQKYCKELADEMLERRNLQKLLDSMLGHLRVTVEHHEKLLKDVKRREEKVKADLVEVERAHQSLPDLSEITNAVPLPTLENLFNFTNITTY